MTWFRVGGAGIPATLKNAMNAVFNKKFGTSGQNYPPKQWPDDVNLLGPLPEGTASGPIANFSDGADDVPIKNCIVTLPGSLGGYSDVNGGRIGKNFLDDTLLNLEQGSINDSTGANESANNRVRNASAIPFPYDEIVSSYTWTIPSGYKVAIRPYDANGNFVQLPSWALAFITQLPQDLIGQGITQMRFVFAKTDNSAITPNDIKNVGFQIEVGSTATAYEAYKTPTQYTAALGRSIYGGTADLVTGGGKDGYIKPVITSDMVTSAALESSNRIWRVQLNTAVYDGNFTYQIGVCNHLTFVDSYTNVANTDMSIAFNINTGKQILLHNSNLTTVDEVKAFIDTLDMIYPIATPTDFSFDGQEINSLYGVNNFWNGAGGDTTVVYRRDIDLALQAVSSSRGLMMASRPVTQLVGEESDPDQVNELVEDDENDEIEQEGEEDNAR